MCKIIHLAISKYSCPRYCYTRSKRKTKIFCCSSCKKPRFIDIAISELVRKCGVCKVSEDAARLLIEVDTKESLGGIRKKRHGTKGMGKEESKEYRARAFAAAALHILNSNGQSNTAPQVARDWGLVYLDLASAIGRKGCARWPMSSQVVFTAGLNQRIRPYLSFNLCSKRAPKPKKQLACLSQLQSTLARLSQH